MAESDILVIGSGVVGWSVAAQAVAAFPKLSVTVLSDRDIRETPTWVAAGSYRVDDLQSVAPGNQLRGERWAAESFEHLAAVAAGGDAGCTMLPMVQVSEDADTVDPHYLKLVHSPTRMSRRELLSEFPTWPELRSGWSFVTALADCRKYVEYLKSTATDCRQIRRRVSSLSELTDSCRLIFNCSGLGARELANDLDVYPVRGQILRVQAPWLKRAVYGPYSTYAYPSTGQAVTVGGVRQADRWDTRVSELDTSDIWSRATRLLPTLASAKVEEVAAGLRPARRGGIRIESERLGECGIVHCYGHGGHGVALSWGTAADAVRLGRSALAASGLSSRL